MLTKKQQHLCTCCLDIRPYTYIYTFIDIHISSFFSLSDAINTKTAA